MSSAIADAKLLDGYLKEIDWMRRLDLHEDENDFGLLSDAIALELNKNTYLDPTSKPFKSNAVIPKKPP